MTWLIAHQFMLMGLIFMFVIGPAVGNYACSVVYRLPRGKTPFERHPYCGHCNADLKPIDLFPIWSWLSTRGKCRYCGGEIPSIYTVTELVCGAVFIGYFLKFGISEPFLLLTAAAVFIVILAAIEWQQGWLSSTIYSYAFLFIALHRTLAEQTIFGVIQGAFLLLLCGVTLARLRGGQHFKPFEQGWIWWWALLGALVPMAQWSWLAPVLVLALMVPKKARLIVFSTAAITLPLFL